MTDCCRLRIPEPTRQADAEVAKLKKRLLAEVPPVEGGLWDRAG